MPHSNDNRTQHPTHKGDGPAGSPQTHPGDEAVPDILRVAGVFLQLLQKRVAVEVQNLLHVTEQDVRLEPQA